jgi:prevent-host-death family protein
MQVATRQLKDQLSHYLGLVQAGEDVWVTSHGRSIARIVPVLDAQPSQAVVPDPLANLAWVTHPKVKGAKPRGLPVGLTMLGDPSLPSLSDLILSDRDIDL